MDLCKRKNEDKLWIDEIAAMQAFSQPAFPYSETSGIILAGEDNETNGNAQASRSDSSTSQGSLDNIQGMVCEFSNICYTLAHCNSIYVPLPPRLLISLKTSSCI